MTSSPRCLYNSSFSRFLDEPIMSILGNLSDNYHGVVLTTAREAWKSEIMIMKDVLASLSDTDGRIIFEYDIPRLGKDKV